MRDFFAGFLSALGLGAAKAGSQACTILWFDEPEAPASLIK